MRVRPVEPEDAAALAALADDVELSGLLGGRSFPTSRRGTGAVPDDRSAGTDHVDLAIDVVPHGIVGRLTVHKADGRRFRYGIGLRRGHRRHGVGTTAVGLLLATYFRDLGYETAEVEVRADNVASLRFHHALGFEVVGRRRAAVLVDGRDHDVVMLELHADRWRTTATEAMLSG
ncbi:MAG TPA: GNAT family protein [Iamia sp.]|nr:GNAT family protein [Iamia sp.]